MKKISLLILCCCLVISKELKCQSLSTDTSLMQTDSMSIDKTLPGLNTFIESALQNSPMLKASDKEIEQIFENIRKKKKSWTEYIMIDGNARYGLFNTVTIADVTSGSTLNSGSSSSKKQLNYFAGITLRLPVSEFLSKKNDINTLKLSAEQAKFKKEQAKLDLTQIVIEEYYKLIRLTQSVQINQNILQSVRLDYMKARKDISNGLINLSEYNGILSTKEKVEESYNTTLNDYFAQYYKIQILTGLKLSNNK